ncbi:MAG: sulfur carrier protein ThiS [Rhizobacter sp.]|nr:sulfur carrier protein ThiS [Rhizobacter sp.]
MTAHRHQVSLNGQALHTTASSLQALLVERGYDLRSALACALNTVFVPRAQWAQQALREGDRVDVVTPIAGG